MGRISIGLGVCSMVEGDFDNLELCVKPIDKKMGQTSVFNKPWG
jgi:hypothetical protein